MGRHGSLGGVLFLLLYLPLGWLLPVPTMGRKGPEKREEEEKEHIRWRWGWGGTDSNSGNSLTGKEAIALTFCFAFLALALPAKQWGMHGKAQWPLLQKAS